MVTPPTSAPFQLAGRKILIVDDDRLNLRILGGILKGEGYVLAEADSGERAIELYATFRPELVLLDVMMPGIDGFETCRRLKRDYGNKCAPVIFITAKNESDDVVEGLGAGGVDYLPKPFKSKEVVARLRSHLQNQILSEQQKLLVEQLSKANAAKNRFLGMAAHDLRNPLASIRGLAEFLREGAVGPLNPDQAELIETIHTASQSMLEMVNELLDVATIESGELKLHLEASNLGELVGKCVTLINMEAAKKKDSRELRVAGHTRRIGDRHREDPTGDRQPAEQRREIFPAGFHRHRPRRGGRRSRHLQHFRPRSGSGNPRGRADKLFKDFSRLSIQPTGGEKSTGLGLAICRKIVEAHRGTIVAENLPSRGCEFRVTLPATP